MQTVISVEQLSMITLFTAAMLFWKNKNTWFFPLVLWKLAFNFGIDFGYRIVGWGNC